MTPRELFGVLVRTVGLCLAVYTTFGIVQFIGAAAAHPELLDNVDLLLTPIEMGLFLCLGLWMLRRSEWLVCFGFRDPAPEALDGDGGAAPASFPDLDAGRSYLESLRERGTELPRQGPIYIAVAANQQLWIAPRARFLAELGYEIVSTGPTARCLRDSGLQVTSIQNLEEHPATVQQALANGTIRAVLSTDSKSEAARQAIELGLVGTTSRVSLKAAINGFAALHAEPEVSE